MKLSQQQVQHLFWRAGLFDNYITLRQFEGTTQAELWERLLKASGKFTPLVVMDKNQFDFASMRSKDKNERQMLFKQSRERVKMLNKKWFDHMSLTQGVLRERMSLFWHNHFACSSKNVFFIQSYLNTIRKHALGNFRDLLHAVSREAAMLQYLNNQQNRKRKPNENFAREVMELFTIGRGNYTENDVKNAARAFTGWSFDQTGEYVLREKQHDYGGKEIFGKTGNFSGDDVLNMLLEKKETALFVTKKLYSYLVNDQPDEKIINELSEVFYQSGYDIQTLLKAIFTSDWFYDTKNIGVKIKSPLDLMVGICRSTGISFSSSEGPLFIQRHLGQMLLNPPNVAGWPGGRDWIDSSTLLFRARLMEFMVMSSELALEMKSSGDVNDQFKVGRLKKLGTKFDADKANKYFTSIISSPEKLGDFLLQTGSSRLIKDSATDGLIASLLKICRTPEYQMC